jgi:hypothetical protein
MARPEPVTEPRHRTPAPRLGRILIRVLLGVTVGFVVVEAIVRVATHSFFVWRSTDDRTRFGLVDPLVGHRLKPNLDFRHPRKQFHVTTDARGNRSTGGPPLHERPLTLAVGDSFTFGDQVDDDKAWPAILQQLTGNRVINGGVPGFGLDQAVLWAERLSSELAPDAVVVAFIPHDVLRCAMSAWSGNPKPWFEPTPDGLTYHAAEVPPPRADAWLRHALSYSVTLDLLLMTYIHWEVPDRFAHHREIDVACGLMDRLVALRHAKGSRIVAVALPQRAESTADDVRSKDLTLSCARARGLDVIDLFPVVNALPEAERRGLFFGHMTPPGNRLVATSVSSFLAHGTPPEPAAQR